MLLNWSNSTIASPSFLYFSNNAAQKVFFQILTDGTQTFRLYNSIFLAEIQQKAAVTAYCNIFSKSTDRKSWIFSFFLLSWIGVYWNADKHSPASSVRSDCVHEQVAKRIANVRFPNIIFKRYRFEKERIYFYWNPFFVFRNPVYFRLRNPQGKSRNNRNHSEWRTLWNLFPE